LKELSLHVMDIIENGLSAGATLITLMVEEEKDRDHLQITIIDNGHGMSEEMLANALDPFFTTRTTRRVGLGLSMIREASRRCDGHFDIKSKEGEGTEVRTSFRLSHIDRAPLGDIASSLTSLIMGNPEVDFVYTHRVDDKTFEMDTRDVKEALDGLSIQVPEVIRNLAHMIRDSVSDLYENVTG